VNGSGKKKLPINLPTVLTAKPMSVDAPLNTEHPDLPHSNGNVKYVPQAMEVSQPARRPLAPSDVNGNTENPQVQVPPPAPRVRKLKGMQFDTVYMEYK
jgi:hypothetical protein